MFRWSLVFLLLGTAAHAAPRVEFNRDIRPLLSDTCFQCHGPDKAKRKADLRLDTRAGIASAFAGGLAKSEAWQRLHATDKKRMPPLKAARQLSAGEQKLIKTWIEQGAAWQDHWAFLAPVRHAPPTIETPTRAANAIDRFILSRLAAKNWKPSPLADRVTLLRRVTLDLTGLPPTPGEVDTYLADKRPGAYARVVDRLLASPRLGERFAIRWLEAGRYADTNGYQNDGDRTMWRWRDWVIEAINDNMPFDRFTVEQLAGDLLPRATLAQKIATGFNRNHRGNAEGGIIPEEYAVEYVADRVETTATVWLGLTMTCARCHDHKYDPLAQKDYYRLFAYFNNVPERGKAVKYGNSPPLIKSPTRRQQEQRDNLLTQEKDAFRRFMREWLDLGDGYKKWEKSLPTNWKPEPFAPGLLARFPLDAPSAKVNAVGGKLTFGKGPRDRAASFDGKMYLDAGDAGNFGFYDRFTLSMWVYPTKDSGVIVSRTKDTPQDEGYSVLLDRGRVQVNLVKRWLDDALRLETVKPLSLNRWQHVAVTYDGSRSADGVRVWVDGKKQPIKVLLDDLNQSFASKEPFRIGGGAGAKNRFSGRIAAVRLYSRAIVDKQEIGGLASPRSLAEIARLPAAKRTPGETDRLWRYFLDKDAPTGLWAANKKLQQVRQKRQHLEESFPTTMVMQEMPTPRKTFVLKRGQYDQPGERVFPGVPALFVSWTKDTPQNRLDLARWLVNPRHPLTARVAVNRIWETFFGVGLVKTPDDFGSQGEQPIHPELLDWLATEYVRLGWDTKALVRLIVTSSTYRQSSRGDAENWKRDPENRFLARGPRFRLSAEMIRDQALAASGLIYGEVGGPSVKPYQPSGLWQELADMSYVRDTGPSLYRRGLYVFWKRTVSPPGLTTFDAPGREACVVRSSRTNTPLQALNLLNDVTYVEAARVLAERVMKTTSEEKDRLTLAFRLILARKPSQRELTILQASLKRHRAHYAKNADAAKKLLTAGDAPRDQKLPLAEHAAYTAVAGVILNLDEAINRE